MNSKRKTGCIGFRREDGSLSDAAFHAEIMDRVDDTSLRRISAIKAMVQFGLTREEVESLFNVTVSDQP
jgi:hypothetical protein